MKKIWTWIAVFLMLVGVVSFVFLDKARNNGNANKENSVGLLMLEDSNTRMTLENIFGNLSSNAESLDNFYAVLDADYIKQMNYDAEDIESVRQGYIQKEKISISEVHYSYRNDKKMYLYIVYCTNGEVYVVKHIPDAELYSVYLPNYFEYKTSVDDFVFKRMNSILKEGVIEDKGVNHIKVVNISPDDMLLKYANMCSEMDENEIWNYLTVEAKERFNLTDIKIIHEENGTFLSGQNFDPVELVIRENDYGYNSYGFADGHGYYYVIIETGNGFVIDMSVE